LLALTSEVKSLVLALQVESLALQVLALISSLAHDHDNNSNNSKI